MTAVVRTAGLRIGYDGRAVAAIPDLACTPDRVWLITGANGSGKTTMLKTLAGLLPPVAGAVLPAPRPGRDGAVFVHSTPVLFRGTVRANLGLAGAPAAAVAAIAQRFDLTDRLDQPVDALSHGLRQRTAIARAALCVPRVLLFDEPEGGLDARALELWRAFLTETLARGETLVVVAAHRPGGLDALPIEVVAL